MNILASKLNNSPVSTVLKTVSLVLLLMMTNSVFAEVVFVSSKTTKLHQEAKFNSAVKMSLLKSSELTVLSKKGRWIEVEYLGSPGWVSKYSVSENRPLKEKVSLFSRFKSFFSSDTKRTRVSVVSTSGGIRGLSNDTVKSTGQVNSASLERLEAITVSEQELEEFIQETQK